MRKPLNHLTVRADLTQEELARFRGATMVAVDAEMTGLNPNRDLLCLVQICDPEGYVALLRTSAWAKASRLSEMLLDPRTLKVFHFALADCSFLLKQMGVEVTNVYCTKIASRIARTYSSEHGLAALVAEFFGANMDKSQQTTDWLRDNLTQEQLNYAACDVLWLIEMKSVLDAMLKRKGLLSSGISYGQLNELCQRCIPAFVHLAINGWDVGLEDRSLVFSP
jgi:ribonuclease D